MSNPTILPASECLAALERYDAILDARSPSEFAIDHLPGAIATPVLDDDERAEVGTLHAREGAFVARRRGAALVSRNIARILEERLADHPPGWRPLIYCWRGGNRSGSLALVLARVGWRVDVLEGGYRAYRRQVVAELAELPERLRLVVLAGRTGTGKSRLLQVLAARGQQVLDLEALAEHRGSVLGPVPGTPQPGQKAFESRLWAAARTLDPARPVFIESESRKIGQCQVPAALIERMRAAECVVLRASGAFRVHLLCEDYHHFLTDPESLGGRLEALHALHGRARLEHWQALAQAGKWPDLVGDLLATHYDPAYDRSMRRNFLRLPEASTLVLDESPAGPIDVPAAHARAADWLVARYDPGTPPG